MLAWPHSGFGAHLGPAIPGDDREGLLRVARDSARAPIHRFTALEFLARWVDHVPDAYEPRVRYYGAYATRRRVWGRGRGGVLVAAPVAAVPAEPAGDWPALRARKRRWAERLRLVFKIEVEGCPRWSGAMSIVAFITEQAVVRRILAPLDRRHVDARAGPWADVAAARA